MSNNLRKVTTKGDGNCFFHAVFGDKNNSDNYESKNANEMRREWYNFMMQFVSHGLNHPEMPSALKEILQKRVLTNFINDKYNIRHSKSVEDLNLYEDYLRAIQKNEYYVFFEEIPILASLADIKVTIHYIGKDPVIIRPNHELLGSYKTNSAFWGNKKEATIFHEGNHFSYAEYTSDINYQQHDLVIENFSSDEKGPGIKYHVKEFLSKLFGINIGNEKFVDISLIDLVEGDQKITVSRSNIVDNAFKQMSDITPLLFIKKAIEVKATDRSIGISYTIDNFIKYILSISNQIQGRCLTDKQYELVKKQLPKTEQKEFFDLKIITTQRDNQKSLHYLISDQVIIRQLEDQTLSNRIDLSEYDVNMATTGYREQIHKYTKYVLNGLQKIILDSNSTLETTCQLMAQFILSVFNKEEETYFSTKDNLLFKEIRFYKYAKEAKQASDEYEVISYKEIVDRIANKEKYFGDNKSPYIRIVDNKEVLITSSVAALNIIDLLTKNIFLNLINNDNTNELLYKYNENYNFNIDTFTYDDDSLDNYDDYNNSLNANNFDKIIYNHAAKHLYWTFDFKSSGHEKIFALKQKGDGTRIVKVYTDAIEQLIEQYSIQNPDLPERAQLAQQTIDHVSLTLSPFSSLNSNIPMGEGSISVIKQIFNFFCELLKTDYGVADLNQEWCNNLQDQFDKQIIGRLEDNSSSLLGNTDVQDNLDFA